MISTVRSISDWLRAKPVLLSAVLLLCTTAPLRGQQQPDAQPQQPPQQQTQQETNQKIQQLAAIASTRPHDVPVGAGDLLHIEVFDVPELSRDVRVSDMGDISYPLIPGRIQAAGLTPFQLEEKMEQLLVENGLVTHPQVSVFVKEQTSQPVSLVGAVARPSVYQIVRPTTLLELLANAGGITDEAGSVVLVTRATGLPAARTVSDSTSEKPGADSQTISIRLQDLLESGDPSFNIQVFGGDVVSVPRAGIVYVMGRGITQPGGYVLQSHGEQISVLKAVALAHGTTGFAKADDSVIMRNNPLTGQREVIPVHLKRIEHRKAEDVIMKSTDILYIPDSVGRKVLARGAEVAIGVGTSLAIYRSSY